MVKRLTKMEREFILNNCSELSINEIADKLGVKSQTVRTFCRRQKISAKKVLEFCTKEQIQYLLDNRGKKTTQELAKDVNKLTSTVRYIWNKYGLKSPSAFTDEDKKYILENYKDKSHNQIAACLGRTTGSIRSYCTRNGLLKNTRKFKIGEKFGKWTVIEPIEYRIVNSRKYRFLTVKCSCEKKTVRKISPNKLIHGESKSCGCGKSDYLDFNNLNDIEKQFIIDNNSILSFEEISSILKVPKIVIYDFYTNNNIIVESNRVKIGDKNNKLTVTSNIFYKYISNKRIQHIKVRCECNKSDEFDININSFIKGRIVSCGCYKKEVSAKLDRSKFNYKKRIYSGRYHNNIPWKFFKKIEWGAKYLNREFDLTIEFLDKLFELQNHRCGLTGYMIDFEQTRTASLDRKDSLKGYTKDNVHWTHRIANRFKQEHSIEKLLFYCEKIISPITNLIINESVILKKKIRRKKKIYEDAGNISSIRWKTLEARAKRDNIELNINPKYIWDLFVKQNGYCAITGLPIILIGKSRNASIDRIDNNKGYITNNIQWVVTDINYMRGRLTIEEFKYWAKLIFEYLNKIPNQINGL